MFLFLDYLQLAWLVNKAAAYDGLVEFLEERGIGSLEHLNLLCETSDLKVFLSDEFVLFLRFHSESPHLLQESHVIVLLLVKVVSEVAI